MDEGSGGRSSQTFYQVKVQIPQCKMIPFQVKVLQSIITQSIKEVCDSLQRKRTSDVLF